MASPDFTALERKYGLPPGLLAAQQVVESGGRDVTSPAGAAGPAQLMPQTARSLGVNPHDPMQAAEGQAKIMADNLKATGGDIERATMMYHGGPDERQWGPKTRAYPQKILAALQNGQAPAADPNDPHSLILGDAPASAPDDPYAAIAGSDTPAPGGNAPGPAPAQSPHGAVPLGGNAPAGSVPVYNRSVPGTAQGPQESTVTSLAHGLNDAGWAALGGIDSLAGTAEKLGALGLDATGLTHGLADWADKDNASAQQFFRDRQYNPDGVASTLGDFGGMFLGAAPAAELKLFNAAQDASKLARMGAKLGNYAAQGGAAGLLTSDGKNMLANTGIGAVGAPVLGAALEKVAFPAVSAAYRGLVPQTARTAIADALAAAKAKAAGLIPGAKLASGADAGAVKSSIASMVDSGATASEIASQFPDANPAEIQAWVNYRAQGGKDPVSFSGQPAGSQPAPDQIAAALKAAGARRGIEATTDLPAPVAARVQELTGLGVPLDHAINQASIEHVGAQPTVGSVTRSRVEQQAEREGAKQATPEGAALASRMADNNAALHDQAQQVVENLGGVPAHGEATQAAAESLAKSSDAARAKVNAAYETARAQDGDQRVSIDSLRELLARPDYQAPTTTEGAQLVNGLRSQIEAMAKENGGRFSPDEIDALSKSANAAYNPMGGGANHMVSEVKSALNDSLDQFDNAGPAYRKARDLHRQWAEQYDDPAGIAKLIQRDAKGNFVNSDNWRLRENALTQRLSDKAFGQVVRQLQANGDTETLAKLKASIVQNAYEDATASAADESGHPGFNARKWETALNKVGLPKLNAIFSRDEIAHLATIGRAARALNEAVPGTDNASNTASALANALRAADAKPQAGTVGKALRMGAHIIAGHSVPGVGNLAVEAAANTASAQGAKAAQRKLAQAIQTNLNPDAARAAANENAISAAEQAKRQALAQALAQRVAAPAISARKKR